MAVYYASTQHRSMGRLLLPGQVRGWIRGEYDQEPDITSTDMTELLKPFKPSPTSVLTISAPQLLLSSSLYSFLVGLGVYVSFVWRRQLDPDAGFNDSRNIFVTYVVSIAVCEIIYSVSSVAQEEQKNTMPKLIVEENCTKFLEKLSSQTERRQISIGNEQSRQSSLKNPSYAAQVDNIQVSTGQREISQIPITSLLRTSTNGVDPQAIQSQLSDSAATEVLQTPKTATESDGYQTRTATSLQGRAKLLQLSSQHQVLIKALQDSARLRRESARLEEVIARCYEQLSTLHQPVETADQE